MEEKDFIVRTREKKHLVTSDVELTLNGQKYVTAVTEEPNDTQEDIINRFLRNLREAK